MCIVGAIIGAAVIGAAGSAVAGSEAAGATTAAANTASQEQQSALAQQEQLAAPYTSLGQSAIPKLQALLGLTVSGGKPAADSAANELAALKSTPGYQFTLQQGLQGVQNSAAARGMLNSGNTLESLDQYGSGLADQTYQQAVGNLENTVGLGQAAAAGQAANIGNAATNLGNIAVNRGNTLAGIDANTIAGIENAAGGAANNYVMANTLANLGGENLTGAGYYSDLSNADVGNQIGYPAAF